MKNIIIIIFAFYSTYSFSDIKISKIYYNNDYLFAHIETLPIVDVSLTFKSGSSYDGQYKGLSNIMLNTLMNSDVEGKKLIHHFENVGANLSYSTNRESISITMRSLSEITQVINLSKLINQALRENKITREVFELEKEKILRTISDINKKPDLILQSNIFSTIFHNTGLAHDIVGTSESIQSLSIEDILKHRNKILSINNIEVNIVGDISEKDSIKVISNLVEGFSVKKKLEEKKYELSAANKHIEFDSEQSHLAIVIPTVPRTHEDYYNLMVANYILGGSGFGSWLMEEIREKRGLSYSVYSYISSNKTHGYLKISLQTKNENLSLSKSIISKQLERLRNFNISEKAINDAKSSILKSFEMRIDTNKKLLNLISAINSLDLNTKYFAEYREKINRVDIDTIKNALDKSIDFSRKSIISVGRTVEK